MLGGSEGLDSSDAGSSGSLGLPSVGESSGAGLGDSWVSSRCLLFRV